MEENELKIGDKVDIVIGRFTNIGIHVLVNEEYEGMLYKNEVYQKVREGQKLEGFVKKVREDGKVDVSLQKQGFRNSIDQNMEAVLQKLKEEGGYSECNDKSDPDSIKYHFKMSKKAFKSAIGGLYKQKKISISENGIKLL
ncbi:DUF1040 family protein [Aureivirga sp. CE67]|uniref:DUF1040 family protein n=1 Tax=Aureivirga sp. CE67 TaxID=1788983 RepID=UPI0018CB3525|nr:DUF1040 family protein [Aureivirga sp. CE67]